MYFPYSIFTIQVTKHTNNINDTNAFHVNYIKIITKNNFEFTSNGTKSRKIFILNEIFVALVSRCNGNIKHQLCHWKLFWWKLIQIICISIVYVGTIYNVNSNKITHWAEDSKNEIKSSLSAKRKTEIFFSFLEFDRSIEQTLNFHVICVEIVH